MHGKSLKWVTAICTLSLAAAAQAQSTPSPPKTRAEVVAEMQAERAAGRLYQPDYYPVFEGSWPARRDAGSEAPMPSKGEKSTADRASPLSSDRYRPA